LVTVNVVQFVQVKPACHPADFVVEHGVTQYTAQKTLSQQRRRLQHLQHLR
jgi:hypothetical protein